MMRYLGEDEITQMMGLGYYGEVQMGPDGNLYQWVEGYDGLGNPIGFWRKLRRRLSRYLPFAQRIASLIPHPYARAVAVGLKVATPLLRGRQARRRVLPIAPMMPMPAVAPPIPAVVPVPEAMAPAEAGAAGWGLMGFDGLGALYQAPDGTLYQVQGLAEDEELRGFAEDEELRGFAEDEELRGWGLAEEEDLRGFAEDEELRGWGLAEEEDLRGLDEDDELRGFAEDEELRGFAEDEELRGLDEDEELRGFDEDEELRGFDEDEELRGLDEDDELRGLYGYVREDGVSGLDAFIPDQPTDTRWFTPPAQPPEMWKPLW